MPTKPLQSAPVVNPQIIWKHYKENFLKVNESDLLHIDDEESPSMIDDDDDDDNDGMPRLGFINMSNIMPHSHMHQTPWGSFAVDNPLSPINMYDLQVANFKGFNTRSVTDFKSVMSSVDGIAAWATLDPYCIVIAPAMLYDTTEVKKSFEEAVYRALSIQKSTTTKTSFYEERKERALDAAKQSYDLFHESGIDNITMILPDENATVDIIKNPTSVQILSVNKLIDQLSDLIVLRNGDFYDPDTDQSAEPSEE
jgi:hypothetical protein